MGFNYVVLQVEDKDGFIREVPIIYPDSLVHIDIAQAIKSLLKTDKNEVEPVSAGSIDFVVESCHGKSTTLDLTSRDKEDRQLINAYPYFHGIK